MKKAGIVVDNYKLDKFKKELTKNGLTNFKIFPFTKLTSLLQVRVQDDQLGEVKKVCEYCELYFKRSN